MLKRFPNEAAHGKAREKALDDVASSVRISEARIKLLLQDRKPLLDEAEFYVGKPLPTKLKLAIDANDAALEAQRSLVQNQQTEVVRINASVRRRAGAAEEALGRSDAGQHRPVAERLFDRRRPPAGIGAEVGSRRRRRD